MGSQYEINLMKGVDFYSINQDGDTLFHNFHILYYFSDFWGIQILQKTQDGKELLFKFRSYKKGEQFHSKKFIIKEVSRKVHSINKKTICYTLADQNKMNFQSRYEINVKFIFSLQEEQINIKIFDEESWFDKQFKMLFQENSHKMRGIRSNINRATGPKQIQYFYKEPENERFTIIQEPHYSIALQGGGVKGISYIGVNSALQNIRKQKQGRIRTIIGSSAGGILGLAICCGMKTDDLLSIVTRLGSIPEIDKTSINQKDKEEAQGYITDLIKILTEFGIIEPEMFSILQNLLENQKLAEQLLQLLQIFNPAIVGLFKDEKGKLTLARLLQANLMKGQEIFKIACDCLKTIFKEEPVQGKTFKQLYEETKVQFSCTSVDLKDEVIRFFNRKTTPDMPVAKAVQMTGSFPVAFKSQQWQSSWGKYYIHYNCTRKEKDLSGNSFTDGGMLSNFPIKYLDNENMRPMYFSHKKTDQTTLYGFGLYSIIDKQYEKKKQYLMNKKLQQIKTRVMSSVYCKPLCCRLLCGVIASCCKNLFHCNEKKINLSQQKFLVENQFQNNKNNNQQLESPTAKKLIKIQSKEQINQNREQYKDLLGQLRKIPLFNFLFQMLNTFINSDMNFEKQCFSQECFNTIFSGLKNIQVDVLKWLKPYDHETYEKEISTIVKKVTEDISLSLNDPNLAKKVKQIVRSNLQYLKSILETNQGKIEENLIVFVAKRFNSIITSVYSQFDIFDAQISLRQTLKIIMQQLDQMIHQQFFHRQSVIKDSKNLIKWINQFVDNLQSIFHQNVFQNRYLGLIKNQTYQRDKIVNNLKKYEQILDEKRGRKVFKPVPSASIITWTHIQSFNFIVQYSNLKNRYIQASNLSIPQISIARYASKKRNNIRSYAHSIMRRNLLKDTNSQAGRNIHIILESKNISQFYFHQYYTYLEQAIGSFNQMYEIEGSKTFRIKTITASGYQSIIAFLHASRLSKMKRNEFVWRLRYSIKPDLEIKNKFSKYQWTQTNEKIINEIQNKIWQERFDLINDFRTKIEGNITQEEVQTQEFRHEFELSMIKLANSRQQINAVFQTVVNYTFEAYESLRENEQQSFEIRLQKAQKHLGSSKGRQNYLKSINETNKRSKVFFKMMLDRFQDLIKYTILISPNISNPIVQYIHDKQLRKEAWKGAILSQTLRSLELKSLIKQILNEMKLAPNVTLQQFYSSAKEEDRITINFLAIQSINQRLTFINHHTRPNMPVWAAMLATSSLPYMYQPFGDESAWRQSAHNINNSVVTQYFSQQTGRKQQYLQSGNTLSRLPLQLMTNDKIRKLIGSPQNQVYFAFTFDDLKKQKDFIQQVIPQMTMKPIDRYLTTKIFCKYSISDLKNFFQIRTIQTRIKQLTTYINSNDNTFLNVYRNQSIQLPIKLSTLDFSRVTKNKEIQMIALQCIEDAQNATFQKINNTEMINSSNYADKKAERLLFMKAKKVEIVEYRNQKEEEDISLISKKTYEMILQFPSALIEDFFGITQRFRIFYYFPQTKKLLNKNSLDFEFYTRETQYKQIKAQFLKIPFPKTKEQQKEYLLNLKIVYASQTKFIKQNNVEGSQIKMDDAAYRIENVYHQINLAQLFEIKKKTFNYTYKLQYSKFYGRKNKIQLQSCNKYPNSGQIQEQAPKIKIQSIDSQFWPQSGLCDGCGSKISVKKFSGSSDCFTCGQQSEKVVYICYHCNSSFCIGCKFIIKSFHTEIFCPLGHRIKQDFTGRFQIQQNLHLCASCGAYREVIYEDKECRISICDLCVSRLKLMR